MTIFAGIAEFERAQIRERTGAGRTQRESVELLQEVVSYHPDDVSRYRLASALGSLAFNLSLDRQFAEGKAGLNHPDLSRMKQALGELGSEAPSP